MPDLMRSDDYSGSETNMRSSCWHGDHQTDLVEITPEEDWWGIDLFPTTSSPSSSSTCSDHGFEVLAKSSSSKPSSGGHSSKLFSCFSVQTEPSCNVEPRAPPTSEVLLIQASSTRLANGNVTEVNPAMENSHHGCKAFEPDQLHMYSDEEPTSPVVNCIGQVRQKKKPNHIAKKDEPSVVRNSDERVMQLASLRSWSGGKWKQMLQLAPIPQASHN